MQRAYKNQVQLSISLFKLWSNWHFFLPISASSGIAYIFCLDRWLGVGFNFPWTVLWFPITNSFKAENSLQCYLDLLGRHWRFIHFNETLRVCRVGWGNTCMRIILPSPTNLLSGGLTLVLCWWFGFNRDFEMLLRSFFYWTRKRNTVNNLI